MLRPRPPRSRDTTFALRSSENGASASAKSTAVGKRMLRSRVSARDTTAARPSGTSGRRFTSGSGSVVKILKRISVYSPVSEV